MACPKTLVLRSLSVTVILNAKREQDKAAGAANILGYFGQMGVFIRDVRHTSH